MISNLNDARLSRKMLVAFGVIGALLSALVGMAVYTNVQLSGVSARHVSRGVAGAEALGDAISQMREKRIVMWTRQAATDAGELRELDERYREADRLLIEAVESYAGVAGAFMPEVERLRERIAAVNAMNERLVDAQRAQGAAASLQLMRGPAKETAAAAMRQVERLRQLTHDRSVKADEDGQALASRSLWFAILLAFFCFAGLAVIWRLIQKTVAQPMAELAATTTALAGGATAEVPHQARADELGEIAKAVERFRQAAADRAAADARVAAEQQAVTFALEQSLDAVSQGDLTADVRADFPPAYATLKTNFNAALASLRELIASVLDSSAALRTGSGEIAQASEDLARRTESNAASLEETSAALTQIDGRIKATAEAAGRTLACADEAITTVSGGRSIADEAVQAMGRVRESAKGIDEVIEGVDKIAFQTRVLAMNAAVEAGRAGDAGRGFAVVADLVSALAMRAEEEAKRARDQLTVTQTDIVTAVEAVQKIDGALTDISSGVGEVHELLGGMAHDNQAQASAITQISAAVVSMDQSTQQNAAMVEETSAAARNLNVEAESLAEKASHFRVADAAPSGRSAAKAVAKTARASGARPAQARAAEPVLAGGNDWNAF